MQDLNKLYEIGKSPIPDEVYDRIFGDSDTLGNAGDSEHLFRMGSIRKLYEGEGTIPTEYLTDCTETTKLDGLACRIIYHRGKLVSAATRGDGKSGTNITHKVKCLASVPPEFDSSFPTVQIRGEIVASKDVQNSRNVVAGAVTHEQDIAEFIRKSELNGFCFVAYDIEGIELKTFQYTLQVLDKLGFYTPINHDMSLFPNDGKVLRINNNKAYYESGFTGNYKNGIIAVKTRKEAVLTKLLSVVWQVSPKGAVVPVAELEPVDIDGAMVSRATLNNNDFLRVLIEDKGLKLGSTVGIIRAGEIIPSIVSILDDGTEDILAPTECPSCGTELEEDGVHLCCHNTECPAQIARLVQHFFSTIGIKGMGIKTAEKFNLPPAEIIDLTEESIIAIIGNKLGRKLYEQITEVKNAGVSSSVLLQAMSIPMVGKQASELLPNPYTWDIDIDFSKFLGNKRAIARSLSLWYSTTFLDIWKGVWPLPVISSVPTKAANLSVCVTGKIPGYTRTQLATELSKYGVEITDSVTKKTQFLICEQQSTSSSYKKAEQLSIPILPLKLFLEKLENDNQI